MEVKEFTLQQRFAPESKQVYYFFPEGTVIWPKNSGRGVLTEDLQAEKQERAKVSGYQAWKAEEGIHLYLDRKHWQLPSGTLFGAPENSAKRRTIKSK